MPGIGELVKVKIIGYKDREFKNRIEEMSLQINPESLVYDKNIKYSKNRNMGVNSTDLTFSNIDPTKLSFQFILDETGVIPLKKGAVNTSIVETITRFERIVYSINGDSHEPNYLIINWGSFVFKGRLKTLKYDYSMFRPNGSPLRVKVTTNISGYMDPLTEAKTVGRSSPDLTRTIVLTAGENIPLWCERIYGDASYCTDIAGINGLSSFRDAKPGTELIFPSLQRK